MALPIQWLDATFSSRTRTEELLRPDFESGLITAHDYHLAAMFFPASHRYWPYVYSLGGSAGLATYQRMYRKPPASFNRTALFATAGGFLGAVWGQLRRAEAHAAFAKQLDDPVAFTQALENVNRRTGGLRPLGWTLQRAKEVAQKEEMHGNLASPVEDNWIADASAGEPPGSPHHQPALVASPNVQNRPKSRWEEIRSANARGVQQSSWDKLRQNHERGKLNNESASEELTRAEGQAQFDALLEAERKMSGRIES